MQYFVFLAWIPFRVSDVDHMLYSVQKYIFFDFQISEFMNLNSLHKFSIALMLIFLILNYISYKKYNLHKKISKLKTSYWILFLIIIMGLIIFFFDGNPEDFIYSKF